MSVEGFEPIDTVIKSHVLCQTELHTQNKKSATVLNAIVFSTATDFTKEE